MFIGETLQANGIHVPEDRIIFSVGEPKLAAVERLRVEKGYDEAILVEDQIDAIKDNTNPRIRVFLASWGYVKREWLRPPLQVPVLDEGAMEKLAGSLLAP
jgi:hypothetical protein